MVSQAREKKHGAPLFPIAASSIARSRGPEWSYGEAVGRAGRRGGSKVEGSLRRTKPRVRL